MKFQDLDSNIKTQADRLRELARKNAARRLRRRDLSRADLEEMSHTERLANRASLAAEDLSRVNGYDTAVEQSTQHALVSALEMLIGRSITLGPKLPVLEPELVDDMQIATRPGETLKLYAPAFDIDALLVEEPKELPTSERLALENRETLALEDGDPTPVLDETSVKMIRQQVDELATQLRTHGAGVEDVEAFANQLDGFWRDLAAQGMARTDKLESGICIAVLNGMDGEQGARLAPALGACFGERIDMPKSVQVSRSDLLGALLDAGASAESLKAFSQSLPVNKEEFNMTDIVAAVGQVGDAGQRREVSNAFNGAARNGSETRLNPLFSLTDDLAASAKVEEAQVTQQGSGISRG